MDVTRYLAALSLLACSACAPGAAEEAQNLGGGADAAQRGDGDVVFVHELEERGREQLRRLLSEYDLEPWMFTRVIRIASYEIPHSHPVLTLGTAHLDEDERQLASFVHEQIHWFEEAREAATNQAIDDLRELYPEVPDHEEVGTRSETSTYLHLIVCWSELDAMAQLIGEEPARRLLAGTRHYEWIYDRVLEDTDEIGAVLARHDLIITPGQGLVVRAAGE